MNVLLLERRCRTKLKPCQALSSTDRRLVSKGQPSKAAHHLEANFVQGKRRYRRQHQANNSLAISDVEDSESHELTVPKSPFF